MYYNSKKVLADATIDTTTARDAYYPYPDSMGRILRIEFIDNFKKKWVSHLVMLLFAMGVVAAGRWHTALILAIVYAGIRLFVAFSMRRLYKSLQQGPASGMKGVRFDYDGMHCFYQADNGFLYDILHAEWDEVAGLRTFDDALAVLRTKNEPELIVQLRNPKADLANILACWKRFLLHEERPLPEMYQPEEMRDIDALMEQWFWDKEHGMTEEEYEDSTFVYHEIVSEDVHIDIFVAKPTARRPYYTLCTHGLGAHTMNTPDGEDAVLAIRNIELMMYLPANWPMMVGEDTADVFDDERNYWPIRLLKAFARMPIADNDWIGYGHTMAEEGGGTYADGVPFSAAMLCMTPEEPDFKSLSTGKSVVYYLVMPITADELDYKIDQEDGCEELLKKLGMDEEMLDTDDGRRQFIDRYLRRFDGVNINISTPGQGHNDAAGAADASSGKP